MDKFDRFLQRNVHLVWMSLPVVGAVLAHVASVPMLPALIVSGGVSVALLGYAMERKPV